jgi:ribosomal protein S12 methylthiotransferase accessory factor
MALTIEVNHGGGKKIDAAFGKFTINTDQSVKVGGEESAPEPFAYFLASLATCAGIYVIGFCQARELPTDGIRLTQDHTFDEKTGKLLGVELRIQVPESFPEKYRVPLERVAAKCAVKKVIENPPEFDIKTVVE